MSNFSFLDHLGDSQSFAALGSLNGVHRPRIRLFSRFFQYGMQATAVGYGVIPANGSAPIITRLYAARIPNPNGPAYVIRRNDEGRWVSVITTDPEVPYKGQFPALFAKKGERFIRVTSTLLRNETLPIHSYNVFDTTTMQWSNPRTQVKGLVGILPVNQGISHESQDLAATRIHQSLISAGFVMSCAYKESFKQELPEGFPALQDDRLLQEGPAYLLNVLEGWADMIKSNVPERNHEDLRELLGVFASRASGDVRKMREASALRHAKRRKALEASRKEGTTPEEESRPQQGEVASQIVEDAQRDEPVEDMDVPRVGEEMDSDPGVLHVPH